MTNEIIHNYSSATNAELLNLVNGLDINVAHLARHIKKCYPALFNEIIQRTFFLEENINIKARLYCLNHNIQQRQICQNSNCSNPVKWDSEKNTFNKYCSQKCCHSDEKFQERIKEANLKKYGVEHPQKLKQIQEKIKSTMIRHYGVEYYSQTKGWKNKCQATSIRRYGTEHPQRLKKIKQKVKNTNKIKYGVEHPIQLEEFKDKRRQTNINRYGVSHLMKNSVFNEKCKKQYKKTCMKKYGVEHSSKSMEVRNKIKTSLNSQQVRAKYRMTCLEKYGVENYSQTEEFSKKCHKRYTNPKYPDMTFATSWEFKVYDFLTEHNIPFEYQPAISIPYECEGTRHTYHPDFLVGDRIVEVKGDNFFRINEETGQEEMYLTWKGDLSDEEYEWKCKLMEAKHQCMIANNVIVLRQSEIKSLTEELFL